MTGVGPVDLLRVVGKAAAPLILTVALAIAAGGGGAAFAAGAAFALGPAIYGVVFGVAALTAALPPALLRAGAALSLCVAAIVGFAAPIEGLLFPAAAPALVSAAWLDLAMRAACACAAACVMTLAFLSIAGRAPDLADPDL